MLSVLTGGTERMSPRIQSLGRKELFFFSQQSFQQDWVTGVLQFLFLPIEILPRNLLCSPSAGSPFEAKIAGVQRPILSRRIASSL
jgi:hypothetical protein